MTCSLLDLPPKARAVFFFGYLGVQALMLIRAERSPDFVFGFQMFNESSNIRIALFRQVRRKGRVRLVPVRGGAWQAADAHGVVHDFHWQARVHDGVLGTLDSSIHASYGLAAQLFRLQLALQDVAAHIPEDHETEALVAVVETSKNGREAGQARLKANRP
jgi:hypothetical protein